MSSEGLRPVVHPYFIALGKPCCLPRCQVPLRRGRTLQPASSTTAACARVCNYHYRIVIIVITMMVVMVVMVVMVRAIIQQQLQQQQQEALRLQTPLAP